MPNYIRNQIIFRDVDAEMQNIILSKICDQDENVDFEILVPSPLNIWKGNASAKHDIAFKKTWYDWNKENWGTKWNASSYNKTPPKRIDNSLIIFFDTAWSPPFPWLAAVFNALKLSFEHNYRDEFEISGIKGFFDYIGMTWKEEEVEKMEFTE